jgi:hypothetical protein
MQRLCHAFSLLIALPHERCDILNAWRYHDPSFFSMNHRSRFIDQSTPSGALVRLANFRAGWFDINLSLHWISAGQSPGVRQIEF